MHTDRIGRWCNNDLIKLPNLEGGVPVAHGKPHQGFLFMNTGQIIKSKLKNDFTQIPNHILKSDELTLEEKGMLCFLLSLPDNWVLYRQNLYNHLKDRPGTIDRVFKRLQDLGYILSVKVIDPKTHTFVGWNHVVYDAKQTSELDDSRGRQTPRSENAEVGESGPINNTELINNTEISTNTNLYTETEKFSEKVVVIGTDQELFITIQPKTIGKKIYRLQGEEGIVTFFDMHKSVVNRPQFLRKFLFENVGRPFNDFMHLWNAYNQYIYKQYK